MRILLLLSIVTLSISSCQRSPGSEAAAEARRDSLQGYDTLQTFPLPLVLYTKKWKALTLHYNGESGVPFARTPMTRRYKGVIFIVDALPVLVTLDTAEAPIDTLFLFDDAGNDLKSDVSEFIRINNDLSIDLTDSIYSYSLDKAGNRIAASKRFRFLEEKYTIDSLGRIDKISTDSIR